MHIRHLLIACAAALSFGAMAMAPAAEAANTASGISYNDTQGGQVYGQDVRPQYPLPTFDAAPASVLNVSSGNVANATATAALAATASVTNYVSGFQCTAAGATGASVANLTIAGLKGGTATYTFVFPAGATVLATPLVVNFKHPIPASAVNTAITLSLPAGGTGNTNAACSIQGFRF